MDKSVGEGWPQQEELDEGEVVGREFNTFDNQGIWMASQFLGIALGKCMTPTVPTVPRTSGKIITYFGLIDLHFSIFITRALAPRRMGKFQLRITLFHFLLIFVFY